MQTTTNQPAAGNHGNGGKSVYSPRRFGKLTIPQLRLWPFPRLVGLGALAALAGLGILSGRADPVDVNYDEAKVAAYVLPDPLTLPNGERVVDAQTWREKRRPEILRLFEEHVYGRGPRLPQKVAFEVTSLEPRALGGKATRKEVTVWLTGQKDGPQMRLLLYVPNQGPKPAPAFLGLNYYGNECVHPDPGIQMSRQWMRPTREMGIVNNRATEATRGCHSNLWQVEKVLARGYALATVYYGDIEPDFPRGWTMGVRAALHPNGTNAVFKPDEWGAIGAWAWGLSRTMDFLELDPAIDAQRVAVIGHSRLGKTALWAGALDERLALVIANNSGEGGASLARRHYGETIRYLVESVPYWFCERYRQYADHENELPVDTHELVALMAPRPVYIASATLDRWADPRGEFLAAQGAGPVYRLFGRAGVGVEQMPPPDQPVGEYVGYHLRTGDHDVTAYDWDQYLRFADRHFQQKSPVIDDCRYADDAAARDAWQPMAGTAPVAVTHFDGAPALRLRCTFAGTTIERASWDRQVRLDLSACRGVEFQLYCRDATPVSYFSLYCQSGDGWFTLPFYPEMSGWNIITLDKAAARVEGKPTGWDAIQTIRLSAWRGGDADTELCVRDFRMSGVLGTDALVVLVRGDSAAKDRPGEAAGIQESTARLAKYFADLGVGCATLSDLDLASEPLRRAQLVVLPHNPAMPDAAVDELARYLGQGGRLLAFYGMPARLRPLVKIDTRGTMRPERPGEFAAMRFAEGSLAGAPSVVRQNSRIIAEPQAVPGASREAAQWLDDQGQPTGHAAVVASSNAVEVSHVLLTDDPANKRRMVLAMAGYLAPAIWRQAADASLARVGRLAGFADFDQAAAALESAGKTEPRVAAKLAEARDLRQAAARDRDSGRFPEACDRAFEAANRMLDAYAAAQQPVTGEFRAFWCHSAFGVEGLTWDAAAQRLADNGFTAILPNMLWGGVAYYDSKVLPTAPEVATRGDQIAECLAACRKHGLRVHVWKVNWNLSRAPKEFIERMRREGRLQADARGKEEPWLCPSHPDNQQLEIDSMVEVARRYDVDGIHFDYIRYPDADHCFCAGCQRRFGESGAAVARWPQDVLPGGPQRSAWLDWRRGNITRVVKSVSEQARAVKPNVKISAAVFPNWAVERDNIGQDWKLWCEKGYLDFVCPMDYTASDAQLDNWTKQQIAWAAPVPCYPGIGAWVLTPDRVIGQIQTARRHQTKGFVLFNYDTGAARDLVPLLGQGVTRIKP